MRRRLTDTTSTLGRIGIYVMLFALVQGYLISVADTVLVSHTYCETHQRVEHVDHGDDGSASRGVAPESKQKLEVLSQAPISDSLAHGLDCGFLTFLKDSRADSVVPDATLQYLTLASTSAVQHPLGTQVSTSIIDPLHYSPNTSPPFGLSA